MVDLHDYVMIVEQEDSPPREGERITVNGRHYTIVSARVTNVGNTWDEYTLDLELV